MGPLLCSCVEVRELIELSFGVVSGVVPGIMFGMGVHVAQGEWVVLGIVYPVGPMVSVA